MVFFGFPGYLLRWNVLYAVAALLICRYMTPLLETFETFSLGWAGLILLRNIVLAILVYGAWHLWLYVWRKQSTTFKYNRQWPKESPAFLFNTQTYDNMFYTLVSGVLNWTASELLQYGATQTISFRRSAWQKVRSGSSLYSFWCHLFTKWGSIARTAGCAVDAIRWLVLN